MKFVIWGAGERGKRIFPHIGKENVEAFIDINPQKWKTEFCGKTVISLDDYLEKYQQCFIVISNTYEEETVASLRERKVYQYLKLSECPGELQETNPRELLKSYVLNRCMENKLYLIYGCTLYSLLMYNWILEKTGTAPWLVPHRTCDKDVLAAIKSTHPGLRITNQPIDLNGIEKIFITVEEKVGQLDEVKEKLEYVFDCSDNIPEYYNSEIEKYKDKHKGKRCFIIATGPSLQIRDLDCLNQNREICISMNRIWYALHDTDWRPDYYVANDYRCLKDDEEKIERIQAEAKFIGDTYAPFWENQHSDNVIKHHYAYMTNRTPKFSPDFSRKSYHGLTVTYTCLQLAVYMGFSEIYLLGVDFDFQGQYDNVQNHFCKEYCDGDSRPSGFFPEFQRAGYLAAKQYTEACGVKIYNATRGGKLEVFERRNFDDLF